jgi:hypothetical protein
MEPCFSKMLSGRRTVENVKALSYLGEYVDV